jgi:hypothetical protein
MRPRGFTLGPTSSKRTLIGAVTFCALTVADPAFAVAAFLARLTHIQRFAISRVLKKSARRNGFPFALAAAFSVEPFDADGVRA